MGSRWGCLLQKIKSNSVPLFRPPSSAIHVGSASFITWPGRSCNKGGRGPRADGPKPKKEEKRITMVEQVRAPRYSRFEPPERLLLGPGPSPVDKRVLASMSAPVLGHLDPVFLQCMEDIREMLRYVFETN